MELPNPISGRQQSGVKDGGPAPGRDADRQTRSEFDGVCSTRTVEVDSFGDRSARRERSLGAVAEPIN